MCEYVWVLCPFNRSECKTRSDVNRASQHKVGERQRVQDHVTRGTFREMGLEVSQRANNPLMISIDALEQARQTRNCTRCNNETTDLDGERLGVAVDHARNVLSWYTDLKFRKVHPLVNERDFAHVGAQANCGPDAAH